MCVCSSCRGLERNPQQAKAAATAHQPTMPTASVYAMTPHILAHPLLFTHLHIRDLILDHGGGMDSQRSAALRAEHDMTQACLQLVHVVGAHTSTRSLLPHAATGAEPGAPHMDARCSESCKHAVAHLSQSAAAQAHACCSGPVHARFPPPGSSQGRRHCPGPEQSCLGNRRVPVPNAHPGCHCTEGPCGHLAPPARGSMTLAVRVCAEESRSDRCTGTAQTCC